MDMSLYISGSLLRWVSAAMLVPAFENIPQRQSLHLPST